MNTIMGTGRFQKAYKRVCRKWGKGRKRVASLFLCAALTASLIGCGFQEAEDAGAKPKREVEVLEQALSGQVSASHSSEAGKEETVYVIADAAGNARQVIVSDWLKNPDGSDRLEDCSDLEDIRNVKGYEGFTAQSGGRLTWEAEGADIYYQGTTRKELPVEVKVSYLLDGKAITPEELAGKSGRVTIRFDYENKQKQKAQIQGVEEELYVPFAMISGLALPGDVFSNIEVTNAKLISEGDNNLVVGVAFPGLNESLKVEEWKEQAEDGGKGDGLEGLEAPDYIEVSADTENFSLNMTMTMAMSDVLSDIAFTDSIDFSGMKDSMEELQDASSELKDGTGQLKDGTGELLDGTEELLDGTVKLKDGSARLLDGAA